MVLVRYELGDFWFNVSLFTELNNLKCEPPHHQADGSMVHKAVLKWPKKKIHNRDYYKLRWVMHVQNWDRERPPKNVWHMFYVIWIFKEKKKKPRPQSTKVPDSKNYKNKVNEWLTKSADPSETQKGPSIEKQQSFSDPSPSNRRKSPLPEKSIIKKPGPLQVKG